MSDPTSEDECRKLIEQRRSAGGRRSSTVSGTSCRPTSRKNTSPLVERCRGASVWGCPTRRRRRGGTRCRHLRWAPLPDRFDFV